MPWSLNQPPLPSVVHHGGVPVLLAGVYRGLVDDAYGLLSTGRADLRVVQTLLGHADITTTQIYTHVASAALVALVNQRHPLAQGRPLASGS